MTKRCKNCGWPNDDNNVKCEKCNAQLEDDSSTKQSFLQTARESNADSFRRTVSENQFFGNREPGKEESKENLPENKTGSGELNCPNCGYPLREGVKACPNCGTPMLESTGNTRKDSGKKCANCGSLNEAEARFCSQCGSEMEIKKENGILGGMHGQHRGTVNPWITPDNGAFCTLKPVAWVGENVSHQPLTFSGESILLNRANTDPNNQSITSTEQAELTFEGGEWFILDKSTQHTTYVLASQKIKLHKGDTIVLGNRLFEFN